MLWTAQFQKQCAARHCNRTTAQASHPKIFTAAKTLVYTSDSEIAEDMIKGTSTGITKLTRHLNDACDISASTRDFAEKLVKTEEKNIEELKKFL